MLEEQLNDHQCIRLDEFGNVVIQDHHAFGISFVEFDDETIQRILHWILRRRGCEVYAPADEKLKALRLA